MIISTCALNNAAANSQTIRNKPLYQLITALRDSLRYDDAIDMLKPYLDNNKKDVDALLLMGQLNELLASVGHRRRAERYYKRALELAPRRTDVSNALAKLKISQTLYIYAEPYYRQSLRNDPVNYDALTGLLDLYILLENKDGIRQFHQQVEQLAEQHPEDVWLKLALGKSHFQQEQFEEAQQVLAEGLKMAFTDYRLLYAISETYIAIGSKAPASEAFLLFLRYAEPSKELEEAFYCMNLVMSDADRDTYKQLPDSSKGAFLERYWRQQDPYPISRENERLLEFLERIAYAKRYYGCGNPKKPFDDRGSVLVRYGPPDDLFNRSSGDAVRPNESWVYNHLGLNMYFDFVDQGGYYREVMDLSEAVYTGGFGGNDVLRALYDERSHLGLAYGAMAFALDMEGDEGAFMSYDREVAANFWEPKMTARTVEPYYQEVAIDHPKLDFSISPVQLRGSDDQTRLLLSFGIPIEQFREDDAGDEELDSLYFINTQAILDKQYRQIAKMEMPLHRSMSALDYENDTGIVSDHTYFINPGAYTLSFQLFEQTTERAHWQDMPIAIRSFQSDTLQMSDILLAYELKHITLPNGAADVAMKPNPFRRYKKGEPVSIFFEVYNLFIGSDNQSQFRVNLKLEQGEQDNIIAGTLQAVSRFLVGGGVQTVESMYQRTESDQEAFEFLALDLSDLGTGQTRLTVTITDEVAQRSASRSIEFEIE